MSYITKCVNKDFMLKDLKPSSNLILFVFSDNLYIGMTVKDMIEVMKQGQNHYFKRSEVPTDDQLDTFFTIQNGIRIDSSLKNCFENKKNTMKLIKSGKFKKGFGKTEEWLDFFSVVEIERKDICQDEKSFFETDSVISDSDSETEIDWIELKKQNEDRTEKLKKQKENEKKVTSDYIERIMFEDGIMCVKEYKNWKIFKEFWYKNNKCHRDPKVEPSGEINDLPALIEYYENGNSKVEYWLQNDIIYRDPSKDLPTCIEYYENGNRREEKWFRDTDLYREGNLPVLIKYSENGNKISELWCKNNSFHFKNYW